MHPIDINSEKFTCELSAEARPAHEVAPGATLRIHCRSANDRSGGRSWRKDVEIVFSDAADNWDCGYPSTIRLADGRLVTAYYTTAGGGDAWSCRGAHCHVLTYREDELLRALRP